MSKKSTILILLCLFSMTNSQAQKVFLYAGHPDSFNYTPTGEFRLSAYLAYPYGLAYDSKGNLWISNQGGDYTGEGNTGQTIGMITPDGMYYNRAGYYGRACLRNGIATGAEGPRFNMPSGIAIGPGDTIYVADMGNSVIRKITPFVSLANPQTTTVVAGKYSYVNPNDLCYTIYPGFADGPANSARFDEPTDLDVDANGNIYVADKNNHCIRKITPSGMVSTIAGVPGVSGSTDGNALGEAKFWYPVGIYVDDNGDIYVSEWGNAQLRKISGGKVSTVIGQVPLWLFNPTDVFKDSRGVMYICDAYRVLKYEGGKVSIFAGSPYHNGPAGYVNDTNTGARFDNIKQVAVDPTNYNLVYVADQMNHVIRKIEICAPYRPAITTSGNLSTCTGDTIILTAPAGYISYQWSNGSKTRTTKIFDKGTLDVFLTVVDTNLCTGISDTFHTEISDYYPVVNASGPLTFCTGQTLTLIGPSGLDYYYWTKNGNVYDQGANKQTINITTTGDYQLKGKIGRCEGFSQLFKVNVTNYIIPDVDVINGDTNLCSGRTVTLQTRNSYNSYLWKKNGTNIPGATSRQIVLNEAGTYTVYVDAGSGCTGTSLPITVTVNPSPPKPVITIYQDSFLKSSSAVNNQWYRNYVMIQGATSQVYYPAVDGNYTVEVSNQYGCREMSDPYKKGTGEGISDMIFFHSLRVYPNPARESLNLSGNFFANETITVEAFNIMGQKMFSKKVESAGGTNTFEFNISKLNSGIYYLKLSTDKHSGILKFLVE